jgi:hypothetical protein
MPTTLELDILTALTTRPRLWTRLSFPAKVTFSRRPVEDVFESDASRLFVTRRAPDAIDLTLDLDEGQLTREQEETLEEIRRLNAPVYVYPRWPGTAQYLWPLRRTVYGDPADATYTGTLVDAYTTVYMVRASTSRGIYLQAIDPTSPVVMPGVYAAEHVETPFPLGQGIALLKPRANKVLNSLFGAITSYVPANWTATAGTPNTDMGVLATSWLGVPALYLWGQSVIWTSDSISLTGGTSIALSFGYKCDGVLTVTLNYDAGTDAVISVGPGAGYYRAQVTVPVAATAATIVVKGSTGMTYGEFAAPQIVAAATGDDGEGVFYGAAGSGKKGALTACICRAASLDIEPHLGERTPGTPDGYGITAISGYIQPLWKENTGSPYGIAELRNTRNGPSTVSAAFSKAPGDLGMFLKIYIDGAVANTQSISHTRGDTYAFVLYSGRQQILGSPVATVGCQVAKVGTPGTIYKAEDVTPTYAYTCFNEVRIGEADVDDKTNCIADAICGGYCVHSVRYTDIAGMVAMMANRDYVDLWRQIAGRQYRMLPQLSPSPWQRQTWGGVGTGPVIELQQYREL